MSNSVKYVQYFQFGKTEQSKKSRVIQKKVVYIKMKRLVWFQHFDRDVSDEKFIYSPNLSDKTRKFQSKISKGKEIQMMWRENPSRQIFWDCGQKSRSNEVLILENYKS